MPRPRRIQPVVAVVADAEPVAPDAPEPAPGGPSAPVDPVGTSTPPGRTPERQHLADMIEARRALEVEIATASAAVDEAQTKRSAASAVWRRAERTLARALPGYQPDRPPQDPEGYAAWQVEMQTPPIPVPEARAALAAAEDDKATAERAEQFWQARLDELTKSLIYRQWNVQNAVKAVVAADPAVATLLADACRRALDYFDASRIVSGLKSGGHIDGRTPSIDVQAHFSDPTAWRLTEAWQEAITRLAADPDATLPA